MSFIGMDSAGGYTTQSMAAVAAQHYQRAANRNGTPEDVQCAIAESLCGLLAMQLARYADEPHDDFDDDDDFYPADENGWPTRPMRDVQLPGDAEPFTANPATNLIAGSDDTEVVDPYSIHRAMRQYENAGITCPHCDSHPCRCAETVTTEAGNG